MRTKLMFLGPGLFPRARSRQFWGLSPNPASPSLIPGAGDGGGGRNSRLAKRMEEGGGKAVPEFPNSRIPSFRGTLREPRGAPGAAELRRLKSRGGEGARGVKRWNFALMTPKHPKQLKKKKKIKAANLA